MPPEDGVGSDNRSNFVESLSPNGRAAYGKSAPLRVGEMETSTAELLLQDAVLFSQIIDDGVLMATDPPGEGSYGNLPGLEDRGHRPIVLTPRRNRQLFADDQTE
jgi:hypothetical protein